MADPEFPATIARGAMRLLPPRALAAGAALLLRRMARAHPALFRDLAALPAARLRIEPTDLAHRFLLQLGGGPPRLTLLRGAAAADATLRGPLAALVALLEGRSDSDTLFFSGAITVTGDSAVVVGLRNTLERDAILLMRELTAPLGRLAGPARTALGRLDDLAAHARARLGAPAPAQPAPAQPSLAPELAALRTEVSRLATRLARLERSTGRGAQDRAA